MAIEARNVPNKGKGRVLGTSKQTGNDAPRFSYVRTPLGLALKTAVSLYANELGYNEDRLAHEHKFPESKLFKILIERCFPYAPKEIDDYRYEKQRLGEAQGKVYRSPIEPFNHEDIANVLRSIYVMPKEKKSKKPRRRGRSDDHHSTAQQEKKLYGAYWDVIAEEMERYIRNKIEVPRALLDKWFARAKLERARRQQLPQAKHKSSKHKNKKLPRQLDLLAQRP